MVPVICRSNAETPLLICSGIKQVEEALLSINYNLLVLSRGSTIKPTWTRSLGKRARSREILNLFQNWRWRRLLSNKGNWSTTRGAICNQILVKDRQSLIIYRRSMRRNWTRTIIVKSKNAINLIKHNLENHIMILVCWIKGRINSGNRDTLLALLFSTNTLGISTRSCPLRNTNIRGMRTPLHLTLFTQLNLHWWRMEGLKNMRKLQRGRWKLIASKSGTSFRAPSKTLRLWPLW